MKMAALFGQKHKNDLLSSQSENVMSAGVQK